MAQYRSSCEGNNPAWNILDCDQFCPLHGGKNTARRGGGCALNGTVTGSPRYWERSPAGLSTPARRTRSETARPCPSIKPSHLLLSGWQAVRPLTQQPLSAYGRRGSSIVWEIKDKRNLLPAFFWTICQCLDEGGVGWRWGGWGGGNGSNLPGGAIPKKLDRPW